MTPIETDDLEWLRDAADGVELFHADFPGIGDNGR